LLNLRRSFFVGSVMIDVPPFTSSTPCRRMRLRLAIRDQFTPRPITYFLATCVSRVHSKAAGGRKSRRLRLSAPTICFDRAIVGAVEPVCVMPESKTDPTAQAYTRASSVGTNWVGSRAD
jgi:hypothetical protein